MKDKLVPSLIGGIVMTLLNNIPIISLVNILCCAGFWSGGIVASWLYRRQTGRAFSMGEGVVLGLMSSVVAAILGTIAFLTFGQAALQAAMAQISQASPELADIDLTTFASAGAIVFQWVLYLVFGIIGGLLGATLFGKDKSQTI